MTSSNRNTTDLNQFDFIVVGAGSAGCVLANRLSADGEHRVLLVEAGGRDNSINIHIPLMVVNLLKDERYTWPFSPRSRCISTARSNCGRVAKCSEAPAPLTGTSMFAAIRPNMISWSSLGCVGWSWEDMLPYFKRMETFASGDPVKRGKSGPINVTQLKNFDKLADAYLDANREAGFELVG